MLGPFDESDMEVDLLGGEAVAAGAPGAQMAGQTWWTYSHRPGYPEPFTDFSHLDLGSLDKKTLYAFTYIQSDREQDGKLKFGAKSQARIWVNGEHILDTFGSTPYKVQDPTVHLVEGLNTVLVKVTGNFRGAGFGLSITDGSRMLPDIRPVVDAVPTAVVENRRGAATPASATLDPGFPNPFNATVTIPFALPSEDRVRVSVLDAAGQVVRVLRDNVAAAGRHQVQWHGLDDAGRQVASGLYLVKLETGQVTRIQKVALLK